MSDLETPSLLQLRAHGVDHLRSVQQRPQLACKICSGPTNVFDVLDFGRVCAKIPYLQQPYGIPVYYRRCIRCSFIFTDFFDDFRAEFWTQFVYNKEYYDLVDPEYLDRRPRMNSRLISALVRNAKKDWIGLDYGAGNATLARLLDSEGLIFDSYDPFGTTCMQPRWARKYNFCSAFEVAEHTPDPKRFIADIVQLCSPDKLLVILGTNVHDGPGPRLENLGQWSYAAPRNGHISLYSVRALHELAEGQGLACNSMTKNLHFFSRGYNAVEIRRLFDTARLWLRLRRYLPRLFPNNRAAPPGSGAPSSGRPAS
jgi:SAM-dependent methyltransferase